MINKDAPFMQRETLIITGAGQRIGLALALHFADKGYQIIISYRTERESIGLLREKGVQCIQADFSTDEGISDFAHAISDQKPCIRAIFHNASSWGAEKEHLDNAFLLEEMLQIHVKAPYLLNMALTPFLNTKDIASSDIIHFTDYVINKGSAKHIAYSASKAALDNLTLCFAKKLAPNTKVNSLSPALILFNENDTEAYQHKALNKSLMQIAPGTDEVINTVNFILQSRYMTGQRVNIDGGRALK